MEKEKDRDIQFFLPPKEGWGKASIIRILEPKEKHVHAMWDTLKREGSVWCPGGSGSYDCPICEAINRKRTLWTKFCILLQDIGAAFKRFFKK